MPAIKYPWKVKSASSNSHERSVCAPGPCEYQLGWHRGVCSQLELFRLPLPSTYFSTTTMGRRATTSRAAVAAALLCSFTMATAHEHHDMLTEEQMNAPIDSVLWIHMVLQATVWGILFPVGMVLGITRSRWHVPLQVSLLTYNLDCA